MCPLMDRDFFGNLPSEITTNILSRLPDLRSISFSKCVCKLWLNLLQSDDFVKSHLFKIKSPPALVCMTRGERNSPRCTIFELEDEDEANLESHDLHYIPLKDFDIPHVCSESTAGIVANGLLLLYSKSLYSEITLYIYNLITRQYIELCCPEKQTLLHGLKFGFGVSKISGQYKVVCINSTAGSSFHHVYTLGTGTWRLIEAGVASGFIFCSDRRILFNGNLHWTAFNSFRNIWVRGFDPETQGYSIISFDVETECFSSFSAPPMPVVVGEGGLSVVSDCLCFSYTHDDEFVIWMMKEYQVEESWTIEYKISTTGFDFYFDRILDPIKLFKDGDMLMLLDENRLRGRWHRLVYYSNKTSTIQHVGMFKDATAGYLTALVLTPSLFSLKNFRFENVISF